MRKTVDGCGSPLKFVIGRHGYVTVFHSTLQWHMFERDTPPLWWCFGGGGVMCVCVIHTPYSTPPSASLSLAKELRLPVPMIGPVKKAVATTMIHQPCTNVCFKKKEKSIFCAFFSLFLFLSFSFLLFFLLLLLLFFVLV